VTVTDDDGDSSSDTVSVTVSTVAPSVSAGEDQAVSGGETVTLTADTSDSSDSVASYSWSETSNYGVSLTDASSATLSFTAPSVDYDPEALTFSVTVTDDDGDTASDEIFVTVVAYAINDTGIDTCGSADSNSEACSVTDYEGQDGEYGRDVTTGDNSDTDGHLGFSFTKIDSVGNQVDEDADTTTTAWECVQDNVTGLMWEVKTDDDGLRDKDWTYSWYNTDSTANGGDEGTSNGGSCYSSADCDTESYVTAVNSVALCGHDDWRMPSYAELLSLVDSSATAYNSGADPTIDIDYFPNTQESLYWTSRVYSYLLNKAFLVNFNSGDTSFYAKSVTYYVRLVRDAD
jgi:hypothetical protein